MVSPEIDARIYIGKSWHPMERLSTVWKSYLPHSMQGYFFQDNNTLGLMYRSRTSVRRKAFEKKLDVAYMIVDAALNLS